MSIQRGMRGLACGILLAASVSLQGARAEGTFDIPAGAHFNPDKLAKIDAFFQNEIRQAKIPGAILLIEQHGKLVYSKMFGVRDVATELSMTPDTIFRLHSMSKAITSVAAMMLIDEGKIKLADPLSKYIPSFANARVGVEKDAGNGEKKLELAPLDRPITILDLMRHTSGITYGFYGDSMVRKAYANANIYSGDFSNAEFAERIARLPLQEQPGTLWDYGHSTDILGRVIEVASGKSLYQFEKQRLLDPLGMKSTGFFVGDPAKLQLVAEPVPKDSNFRVGNDINIRKPMKWESGGGGMYSTIADFAQFCRMLLNGGSLNGKRYLSSKAFTDMTTDHVGPKSGVDRDYFYFPGDGFGFGLGFGVRTDPGNAKPPPPGSLGEIKWDGASGTYFVVDRKQDMFFVLLEQTPTERQRIQPAVKKLIYEALEK